MIDPAFQTEWLGIGAVAQQRGIIYAPGFSSAYGFFTAPIPTVLGESPGHVAPNIPQAMPGGVHVTSQRNGADVFIGDVVPGANYAGMKAPAIPTVGGNCD